MKKHITTLLAASAVLVATVSMSCSRPEVETGASCGWAADYGYSLVWEDDFDGECINTSVWNFEDNSRGGGNGEMQYYTPKNACIEVHETGASCLVLKAMKENYRNRPATSARVNTQGKLAVKYGVIEARIKTPATSDGLWPAFWMLGANITPEMGNDDSFEESVKKDSVARYVVWPKCGEIDILEMGHADGIKNCTQTRYFNGACHWGEDANGGKYPNLVMNFTADSSLQDDFHLYSLVWTPDSIKMFLDKDRDPDAKPYYTLATAYTGEENEPGTYFNHPFYIVMNLAVGGYFTGLPAPEKYPETVDENWENFQHILSSGALASDGTPSKMYVDYVRIWQRGDEGEQFILKK